MASRRPRKPVNPTRRRNRRAEAAASPSWSLDPPGPDEPLDLFGMGIFDDLLADIVAERESRISSRRRGRPCDGTVHVVRTVFCGRADLRSTWLAVAPPFALERLFVTRHARGRITRVRYVLPGHKAANWVGPGRARKSARPGASGGVQLTPFEFLDRLADLVPPPRKHRHRYHGVFAPNHTLRRAVTAMAIGNVGKLGESSIGRHGGDRHGTGGCCAAHQKPRSHDTSRIAWAKLMARVGEKFPLECPNCGGDIRLIAFITEPGPIRRILAHLGEQLKPPPVSPARGPPTAWGELVQMHDDRAIFQESPDELPVIDIRRL